MSIPVGFELAPDPPAPPTRCPPHLTNADSPPLAPTVRLEAVNGDVVEPVAHQERECDKCHQRVLLPAGPHRRPRPGWELRATPI